MDTIRFNLYSSLLIIFSLNNNIERSTSDPLLEIPFIRKILQDYRKKTWRDYYHKLLLQCTNGPKINNARNILSVTKVLEHLYQCLVTQHEEIYKAPQRIKTFKIYDLKAELMKTGFIGADEQLQVE